MDNASEYKSSYFLLVYFKAFSFQNETFFISLLKLYLSLIIVIVCRECLQHLSAKQEQEQELCRIQFNHITQNENHRWKNRFVLKRLGIDGIRRARMVGAVSLLPLNSKLSPVERGYI